MVSARDCPERIGRTGTLPWHESELESSADRMGGAQCDPAHYRVDYMAGNVS